MEAIYDKVQEAAAAIRGHVSAEPTVGIILGTGLGGLAEDITVSHTLAYDDIPHFPLSTVESHHGRLVFGTLGNKSVVAMQGRFHFYEGYDMQEVTFPVRVLKALGIQSLFISNAAGCMNAHWHAGDLMLIADHINFQPSNPLIGPNDDRLGVRFPDMLDCYDPQLLALAEQTALELGITLRRGVYVAVPGPNLETRAEYRMLQGWGADAVGMSTVPEVIVGVHGGLRICAVSVLTDDCLPDALEPANIEKILAVAAKAEPRLTQLLKEVIERL